MSANGIAVRLFFTCWLVYGLFFATDVIREHYLAVAIGDHLSFRVDEYHGLHPDLFEKEGYGWHIGNNPGASMIAALPYAALAPAINAVANRVERARRDSGRDEPPAYGTEWKLSRRFYDEAWRRGLDVKLGLAAFVTHAFCMAPLSALAVVLMFFVLRRVFGSDRTALWLALLYAFGTPIFFRTGFLNQNLMLGYAAFLGFIAVWDPAGWKWSRATRLLVAGSMGGLCVLLDYSGVIALGLLFLYALVKRAREAPRREVAWAGALYALGAAGPILLLWFYQWRSFGHPFRPPQHWMPWVEWIERGYQGFGPPQLQLLVSLALDHRYGLFVSCPLFLLALVYPFVRRHLPDRLPDLEATVALLIFAGFWVFFSGSNYTRLQFNTGIRYLTPAFPFLFLPAAAVLMALPRRTAYFIALFSVFIQLSLAMYREVQRPLGMLDPILRTLVRGFELPALRTLSLMEEFSNLGGGVISALPLFALAAAILYGIWAIGPFSSNPGRPRRDDRPSREALH